MWIIDAPSSTARLASAAYSSGVYGIAGHCSRFAIAPEMEQLIITGSSKRLTWLRSSSLVSRLSSLGGEPKTDRDSLGRGCTGGPHRVSRGNRPRRRPVRGGQE